MQSWKNNYASTSTSESWKILIISEYQCLLLFSTNQTFNNNMGMFATVIQLSAKKSNYCMHATGTVTWNDDYFDLKLKTITITLTNLKISIINSFHFLHSHAEITKNGSYQYKKGSISYNGKYIQILIKVKYRCHTWETNRNGEYYIQC